MTPLTTPAPTPSLVKTSLIKASAVDPENWVRLLIDRALRKICFNQSKALPRSGQRHNWHKYEISVTFVPHWRHFAGKPVVASRDVMTIFSGNINQLKLLLSFFSVVGLVNQPCLSVLLFLKFVLQSKTAVKWVPCDWCTALPSGNWKNNGLFGHTGHDGNYFNRNHGRKGSSWGNDSYPWI